MPSFLIKCRKLIPSNWKLYIENLKDPYHATLLHLLGLNHERLTFRYSGRDFRLTDVSGEVVKTILA